MRVAIKAGILLLQAAILAGAVLWMPVKSVTAQGPDIEMHVIPALEGHTKYDEWLPLYIQLINPGSDVDAEVQVVVQGGSGKTTYAAPALLPAGAHKEIILYVQPPSYAQALMVELVSDKQILVETEVDVVIHPRSAYLIGILAPEPDAFSALNGLDLSGRDTAELLMLTLKTLPSRAEALRSLDCLILSSVDTSALTPAQAVALQIWIEEGGRLIIGGGASAQRTLSGLPEALRPAEHAEIVELDVLESLEDFVGQPILVSGPFLAALPGKIRGRILLEEAKGPLLIQTVLGEGWVSYLTLDPAGSPFNAWTGSRPFWRRLLEPGAALNLNVPRDISERALESEQMEHTLSNLPSLELPSIRWLTLLLGIYIVLVGPVNYLVLQSQRRLELAWVTIPTLTLLFSAAGYGLGYKLRGNDVIINQITIVTLRNTSQHATARSYIGLFSPTRYDYELKVGMDALVGPVIGSSRSSYGVTGASMNVLQGNPTTVRDLDINQWAMQSVQAEAQIDAMEEVLDAELSIGSDSVTGVLRNNLGYPLEGVVIVIGTRFAILGDVGANQELDIAANLESDTTGAPFPWSLFQYEVSTELGNAQSTRSSREQILSAYFHTNWGVPLAPTSPILLAWTDEQPIDVQISDVRASHQGTTLLVLNLSPRIEEGHVTIPFGMLPVVLSKTVGEAGQCGIQGSVYLLDGTAQLEYTLPPNMYGLHLSELRVRVSTDHQPGWTRAPQVKLYDWSKSAWVEITSIEHSIARSIADPARFLDNTSGTLRLLVAQTGRENGMCYQFDLSLEGEIASSTVEALGE